MSNFLRKFKLLIFATGARNEVHQLFDHGRGKFRAVFSRSREGLLPFLARDHPGFRSAAPGVFSRPAQSRGCKLVGVTSCMPLPPSTILDTPAAKEIQGFIRTKKPLLKTDSLIVFLCGAIRSERRPFPVRDVLLEYARKHFTDFRFFRAEEVFQALSKGHGNDLLTIEDQIGKYSDCIAIICESESAFAELGAFTLKDELVKQVLVINDERYRNSNSFITQGPIARANQKSQFKPAVYANYEAVLKSAVEIHTRLQTIRRSKRQAVTLGTAADFKSARPKFRLLFLADLVHIFFPISVRELEQLLQFFYGAGFAEIRLELALLESLKFINKLQDDWLCYGRDETSFFFDYDPALRVPKLRAGVIRHYFKCDRTRMQLLHSRQRR